MSDVFSSIDPAVVQSEMNSILKSTNIGDLTRPNGRLRAINVYSFGGRIWEKIKSLLGNIDLSSMTKEEFLSKVDALYDSMIAPSIIAINPLIGPLLNAALNQIILNIAGNFYDNHSGPKESDKVESDKAEKSEKKQSKRSE